MRFSSADYRAASASRVDTARRLFEDGRYAAAVYFAGVAVECLLRAYILREGPGFDERHDLRKLYKSAQLEAFIRPQDHPRAGAWLGDIWARWKNDYRFASEDRLRAEYRRLGYYAGIRGDFLKENCRLVVESALQLVALGERRWNSRKN